MQFVATITLDDVVKTYKTHFKNMAFPYGMMMIMILMSSFALPMLFFGPTVDERTLVVSLRTYHITGYIACVIFGLMVLFMVYVFIRDVVRYYKTLSDAKNGGLIVANSCVTSRDHYPGGRGADSYYLTFDNKSRYAVSFESFDRSYIGEEYAIVYSPKTKVILNVYPTEINDVQISSKS